MRILFFSHYFPPEGNAPASRVYEMARRWVRAGHEVTVVTCAPNHPDGILYEGYANKLRQTETIGGIRVVRVWTYLAANRGTARRIANYLSYMISAPLASLAEKRPDVLIATSPQFFCGWAGVIARRLLRTPFVLEIRDIGPESIVAVGAMKRPRLIRILERLEKRMYAAATHIVAVGNGYKQNMIEKGVPSGMISVIPNGADLEVFSPRSPDADLKARYDLAGHFTCAYIGTIGMASGLDVVHRAARILRDRGRTDVKFLIVGAGAVLEQLRTEAADQALDNVIYTGRQDKRLMPAFQSITDACLVHLKKLDLFRTVLPSKIFEAAAMAKPIILGVEGESADLIERAGGGICIEPENEEDLAAAVEKLADTPALAKRLGQSGHDYVARHFNRDHLAEQYMEILEQF